MRSYAKPKGNYMYIDLSLNVISMIGTWMFPFKTSFVQAQMRSSASVLDHAVEILGNKMDIHFIPDMAIHVHVGYLLSTTD